MINLMSSFHGSDLGRELSHDPCELAEALSVISDRPESLIDEVSDALIGIGEREQLADFCEKLAAKLREETEGE